MLVGDVDCSLFAFVGEVLKSRKLMHGRMMNISADILREGNHVQLVGSEGMGMGTLAQVVGRSLARWFRWSRLLVGAWWMKFFGERWCFVRMSDDAFFVWEVGSCDCVSFFLYWWSGWLMLFWAGSSRRQLRKR